jgi:uroporphyrinogen decarboxylase
VAHHGSGVSIVRDGDASKDNSMNSRERLLAALNHQEPDRIPFDLGSTQVTGIHVIAYQRLREYLGLPQVEPQICDIVQGLALPDDDVIEKLGVDVRGLFPLNSHNWNVTAIDAGDNWEYHDEWGLTQHKPKPDGLYFSVVKSPLDRSGLIVDEVQAYAWPDTGDVRRIAGFRELAERYRAQGQAVMIKGVLAGIFEMSQRVRGMQNIMIDLASNEALACAFLDKMVELKIKFWETALTQLGDVIDVISEADDYGTQTSQLISPRMFRKIFKPRLQTLFTRIHQLAPDAKLFFHSDGNIRPILPDLIEIGIDILNPIHITATGMEPSALKRDFGKDVAFWGGGVETQSVLPFGTPLEVKDNVRRNIDALASGGGYVFNTIHNIQADVPPQNIVAMIEALRNE